MAFVIFARSNRSVFLSCCAGFCLFFTPSALLADDWPQWLGPKRDSIWRESAIVDAFPATGPKFLWKAPIGSGYAGPALAEGKVFVTDHMPRVTGKRSDKPAAEEPDNERITCLDEKTGQQIWQHHYECSYEGMGYPSGPRATPVVKDGRVYTLGGMGDLLCLNASDGKVVWSVNFVRDRGARVPVWGFAAHPLLDGQKLICLIGGTQGLVVAFDKDTGKELWHALSSKQTGYCPPMIYQVGSKRELIIWNPEAVAGLDPETGHTIWTVPWHIHAQSSMSTSTPRYVAGKLFLTSFYNGPLMLGIDPSGEEATVLWKGKWFETARSGASEIPTGTDGLHCIISTPFMTEDAIYGVCSYGEFRALDVKTGKRFWETFAPTTGKEERFGTAFVVKHEDRYFLFSEKGDLVQARLSREKYEELGRMHIIEPTNTMAGRPVVWTHPAFANRCVYARNDKEIVCVSLAANP